jgi:multicomponent Na+:H+ antiporter subunit G
MAAIVIGGIFLLIGGVFMVLGALGLVRMPDLFNRVQAGTKATTLGFLSMIIGVLILRPEWWSKLLLLAGFVLLTNPIGSHAIARAAHGQGEKARIDGVDRLSEDREAAR